ncbi:MAG: hypothetical protein D3909_16705, partial [Candidatus Electrothrix sp. ATG1]|nr:hypothetical protein [Candidatus Electrothrix sp. ATG1]
MGVYIAQSTAPEEKNNIMPKRCSIFFSAALLVYLAGCRHTVQEKFQPSVTLPKAYSLTATDKAFPLPSQWWQSFDDKLLAQYIQ